MQQGRPNQQKQNNLVTPDEATDRQLLDLLQSMDNFTPIVPDALTDYLMTKAGVGCDDVRLKRLVALIAQKYVTDIANDAMHYSRQRQAGPASVVATATAGAPGGQPGRPPMAGAGGSGGPGGAGGKKITLTMEDLSSALADHGINVKRPNYFT